MHDWEANNIFSLFCFSLFTISLFVTNIIQFPKHLLFLFLLPALIGTARGQDIPINPYFCSSAFFYCQVSAASFTFVITEDAIMPSGIPVPARFSVLSGRAGSAPGPGDTLHLFQLLQFFYDLLKP